MAARSCRMRSGGSGDANLSEPDDVTPSAARRSSVLKDRRGTVLGYGPSRARSGRPTRGARYSPAFLGPRRREVKGYRVRLRVVEEYEVALLAESEDDAKARAEADVRGGGEFESIEDSWPEEIVSVE